MKLDYMLNENMRIRSIDNEQFYMTIKFSKNTYNDLSQISHTYDLAYDYLSKRNIVIFHERVFGSSDFYSEIDECRKSFCLKYYNEQLPYSYIGALPVFGEKGLAGIQIHGVSISSTNSIENVVYNNKICGRFWKNANHNRIVLNSYSKQFENLGYTEQYLNHYSEVTAILKEYEMSFYNVVRTWIYIPDILKKYSDFNKARNQFYKDIGLLNLEISDYEGVYMPASTGIGCDNPYSASSIMDIYAIKVTDSSSIKIINENGTNQRSAYRYGSAFARSNVVKTTEVLYLFLSGTASINEKGQTTNINDVNAQIINTHKIIQALLNNQHFNYDDLLDSTIFIKNIEDVDIYRNYVKTDPSNNLFGIECIADICRDDLLFEIDAVFGR